MYSFQSLRDEASNKLNLFGKRNDIAHDARRLSSSPKKRAEAMKDRGDADGPRKTDSKRGWKKPGKRERAREKERDMEGTERKPPRGIATLEQTMPVISQGYPRPGRSRGGKRIQTSRLSSPRFSLLAVPPISRPPALPYFFLPPPLPSPSSTNIDRCRRSCTREPLVINAAR